MLPPMSHTRFDTDRYAQALRFAATAHAGQTVPGTPLPYIVHVATVAAEVMAALAAESHPDPDLAIACALLHDTLEDTATTFETLEARFGRPIADGVAALSKDATLPKAERMEDSLRRIRKQPRDIWLVKLADRITNLVEPPRDWSALKRAAYREEAMRIGELLGEASPYLAGRLAERLDSYLAFIHRPAIE